MLYAENADACAVGCKRHSCIIREAVHTQDCTSFLSTVALNRAVSYQQQQT